MYLLGYDIGSSSVKASLVAAESGKVVASAFYPKQEAPIISRRQGWAEQQPDSWWEYLMQSTHDVMSRSAVPASDIAAIGISYQMHGLVCVDKSMEVLRPAIIWCDSRGVPYGQRAFGEIGGKRCLSHLLNSPGNFTASKLAWVRDNEPQLFERIHKIMLPGDYIAMRMTGNCLTTISGLSEMMLWDYSERRPARFLLDYFGFPESILPDIVPTFSQQGQLLPSAAAELGLAPGTPVTYRAGDQPNNALSLNVFNPGEIASTAGTSGVVYGVSDVVAHDPLSRVNIFAHVNYSPDTDRLGVMHCLNGTGILNSWMRRNVADAGTTYDEMNQAAASIPIGSEGISILPFGNGAERILQNKELGCSIHGIDFNRHSRQHLMRAAQEGIVFAFKYGIDIMEEIGTTVSVVHAGNANMFLSDVFTQTLASVTGATIDIYDTDGSVGAARAAGMGAGIYKDNTEAFSTLRKIKTVEPDTAHAEEYKAAYNNWKSTLESCLEQKR